MHLGGLDRDGAARNVHLHTPGNEQCGLWREASRLNSLFALKPHAVLLFPCLPSFFASLLLAFSSSCAPHRRTLPRSLLPSILLSYISRPSATSSLLSGRHRTATRTLSLLAAAIRAKTAECRQRHRLFFFFFFSPLPFSSSHSRVV